MSALHRYIVAYLTIVEAQDEGEAVRLAHQDVSAGLVVPAFVERIDSGEA